GRTVEDRHLPGPARAEGAVDRQLLYRPGQCDRGAPAPRVRAEGVPAHPGGAGGAVSPGGRGHPGRPRSGRPRPARAPGQRIPLYGMGAPRRAAPPDRCEVARMHDVVELRSDTFTLPSPAMREAMARADVRGAPRRAAPPHRCAVAPPHTVVEPRADAFAALDRGIFHPHAGADVG